MSERGQPSVLGGPATRSLSESDAEFLRRAALLTDLMIDDLFCGRHGERRDRCARCLVAVVGV